MAMQLKHSCQLLYADGLSSDFTIEITQAIAERTTEAEVDKLLNPAGGYGYKPPIATLSQRVCISANRRSIRDLERRYDRRTSNDNAGKQLADTGALQEDV